MALYYFHLRNHVDVLLDPEGRELDDRRIARSALAEAREIIAADVRSGSVDLDQLIEVQNSAGTVVHSISFEDAVKIHHSRSG
jgi:hypothetical protein